MSSARIRRALVGAVPLALLLVTFGGLLVRSRSPQRAAGAPGVARPAAGGLDGASTARPWPGSPAARTRELRRMAPASSLDTAALQRGIANEELQLRERDGRWQGVNRHQELRFAFGRDGAVEIGSRADESRRVTLRLASVGRGGEMAAPAPDGLRAGRCMDEARKNAYGRCVARLELERAGVTEWYDNRKDGLEQGFDVAAPPAGEGPLVVAMEVSGGRAEQDGAGAMLHGAKGERLAAYGKLVTRDANGREAPGVIRALGDRIELAVDDRELAYPIAVDPIVTAPAAILESNQAAAYFGSSVSGAGDLNGDGYADLVVGASGWDGGETDEGAAFVYYGSAAGLGATPTVLESNQAGASFGYSVSGAGDVNCDGYADLVVGAPRWDGGEINEGAAFVYYGGEGGIWTTPSVLESNQAGAQLGWSVSGAGDLDGNGCADLAVGANYYDNVETNEGAVFVYYGGAAGIGPTATVLESNQAGAQLGYSVSGAGDLNADGYADLVAGAHYFDGGQINEGAVFVYYGGAAGIGTTATALESNQAGAQLGYSVSGAGDLNGDGYADLIAGANGWDGGQMEEGAAFVYYGGAAGIGTTATVLESNQAFAYSGSSVSGAGDLDGDGYADLVVGAQWYDNGEADEGVAFVYHGGAAGIGTTATVLEANQAGAAFGISVSGAGDLDGDGFGDVVVGANAYDDGETDEGAAFVYSGSADGIGTTPTVLESNQAGAQLGWSVSGAGDLNGDGYGDLVVGAYSWENGQTDEGGAFVYYGGAAGIGPTPTVLEANQAVAGFARSVSGAGDLNGDGYGDLVVGAPSYGTFGAAFIYYGGAAGVGTTPTVLESNQGSNFGESVSGAGDLNGDGYADLVVGAHTWNGGQTAEGAAFVHYGSAAGIGTMATVLESNQVNTHLGYSVSGAGDLNGDGYADLVVGANLYTGGQLNEGAAFVYYGGAAGIGTTPTVLESNQAGAQLGYSVSGAGDLNGDGHADLVVGAARWGGGEIDEGAAFVYYGGTAGVGTTPAVLESNQGGAYFGSSVSGAGDLNGDGYADLVVGAPGYNNVEFDEGAAFVYDGGAAGIGTTPTVLESNQAGAGFGRSVSGAGDLNGDGYGDLVVGAYQYDDIDISEGAAFVFYGGGGANALRYNPRQARISTGVPLQGDALVSDYAGFRLKLFARSTDGRTRARIRFEVESHGRPFDNAGAGHGAWFDTGIAGREVSTVVPLSPGVASRWRARLEYADGGASPWLHFDRGGTDAAYDARVSAVSGGFLVLLVTDGDVGASCTAGGVRLIIGLDDGDGGKIPWNGVLEYDAVEVGNGEIDEIDYVCNGTIGATGPAGHSSIVTTDATVGTSCDAYGNGGTRIRSGIDDGLPSGTADNGVLEAGEVDSTAYVCNGASGPTGHNSIVVTDTTVGTSCDAYGNGGQRIRSGVDDGLPTGTADDGILQAGEVDSTAYVCNGASGPTGHNSIVVTDATVGTACDAYGGTGTRIQTGVDDGLPSGTADDGILQAGEVDSTAYVCNGATGPSGHDSIIVTDATVGTACDAYGGTGTRIQTGVDDGLPTGTADDGVLQAGEVDSTAYVCNGAAGPSGHDSIIVTDTTVGTACDAYGNGGQRMRSGLDDGLPTGTADDGILQDGEVDSTAYVCNGATGADGHALLVTTDTTVGTACDAYGNGGTRIRMGLDDGLPTGTADDGVLQDGEVDSTAVVCNGASIVSLVAVVDEPPGANCANGGKRIDSGVDSDRDGILDPSEVTSTAYVCDGATGHASLILIDADVGTACSNGGQRIRAGADDGAGGGTADDGILQAGEVDSTAYVCNGPPGADGTDGANGKDGSGCSTAGGAGVLSWALLLFAVRRRRR